MQVNKADKSKENSWKEDHQGLEIWEMETKIPLLPQKTMTPILVMMDRTLAVGEVEVVTRADNPTGGTLSTPRSS